MLDTIVTIAQAASAAGTETVMAAGDAAAKPQPTMWESIMGLLPMIVIIGAMFYLMYRGQKKEQKRRAQMIDAVKAGDKVVTIGGIRGTINAVKGDFFVLAIADNVKIEISKSAVASVVNETEAEVVKK